MDANEMDQLKKAHDKFKEYVKEKAGEAVRNPYTSIALKSYCNNCKWGYSEGTYADYKSELCQKPQEFTGIGGMEWKHEKNKDGNCRDFTPRVAVRKKKKDNWFRVLIVALMLGAVFQAIFSYLTLKP